MSTPWDADRVADAAPDAKVAAAGLKLAEPASWTDLGHHGDLLWGLCKGSGKNPYQVSVDTSAPAFRCSCPSRKFPCKHAIALLHLWCRGDTGGAEPADFAAEWAAKREQRAARAAQRIAGAAAASPERAARAGARIARREARISEGLDELDRWMLDQVEQGLATTAAGRGKELRRLAARMVDAQAPGVALRLQELSQLKDTSPDDRRRLTEGLGALHLLARAWGRRESLPAHLAACVRREVGLTVKTEEVLAAPGVEDRWLCAGSRIRLEGRMTARDLWLHGTTTGRWGRVVLYGTSVPPLPAALMPGTCVDARVHFYPDGVRAVVQPEAPQPAPLTGWAPHALTTDEARLAWRDALARDPWTDAAPLLVAGRLRAQEPHGFALADDAGDLSLEAPAQGLRYLALVVPAGRVVLAAVMSPEGVRPLSLISDGGEGAVPL